MLAYRSTTVLTVFLLLLISGFTFIACHSREKNSFIKKELGSEEIQGTKSSEVIRELKPNPEEQEIESIAFPNFKINIYNFSAYNIYSSNTGSDTLIIDQEPVKTFEKALLQIIPNDSTDKFEIEEKYITGLRVYVGEKQIKDLKKWERSTEFVRLNDSSQLFFRTISYQVEEKEREVNRDFKEIKDSISNLKGEYINESLETASSMKSLPLEFWVIKSILKIKRIGKDGTSEEKLIIVNTPWGC